MCLPLKPQHTCLFSRYTQPILDGCSKLLWVVFMVCLLWAATTSVFAEVCPVLLFSYDMHSEDASVQCRPPVIVVCAEPMHRPSGASCREDFTCGNTYLEYVVSPASPPVRVFFVIFFLPYFSALHWERSSGDTISSTCCVLDGDFVHPLNNSFVH